MRPFLGREGLEEGARRLVSFAVARGIPFEALQGVIDRGRDLSLVTRLNQAVAYAILYDLKRQGEAARLQGPQIEFLGIGLGLLKEWRVTPQGASRELHPGPHLISYEIEYNPVLNLYQLPPGVDLLDPFNPLHRFGIARALYEAYRDDKRESGTEIDVFQEAGVIAAGAMLVAEGIETESELREFLGGLRREVASGPERVFLELSRLKGMPFDQSLERLFEGVSYDYHPATFRAAFSVRPWDPRRVVGAEMEEARRQLLVRYGFKMVHERIEFFSRSPVVQKALEKIRRRDLRGLGDELHYLVRMHQEAAPALQGPGPPYEYQPVAIKLLLVEAMYNFVLDQMGEAAGAQGFTRFDLTLGIARVREFAFQSPYLADGFRFNNGIPPRFQRAP